MNRIHGARSHYIDAFRASARPLLLDAAIIVINRYGSFGRNTCGIDHAFDCLRPTIALSDVDQWGVRGARQAYTVESVSHVRNKDSQINLDYIQRYLHGRLRDLPKKRYCIVWKSDPDFESYALSIGASVLAMPSQTSSFLEDKNNFFTLLHDAGVPEKHCLPYIVVHENEEWPVYELVRSKLDDVFVIQVKGAGGRGTNIIRSKEEYERTRTTQHATVRMTAYCNGFSASVNILTVPRYDNGKRDCSVYVSLPFFRATGIPDIGNSEVVSAGSDWTIPFPKKYAHDFIQCIEMIGRHLYMKYGLIGMWGLDSVWNDDGFVFHELNCRFMGSTEVSSINDFKRGVPSFYATHHMIFLGKPVTWMPDAHNSNTETSRLMCENHDWAPFYLKIKVRNDDPPMVTQGLSGSGVYKITPDGQLIKKNNGTVTSQANLDDDELLLANLPDPDTTCHAESQICTIEGVTRTKNIYSGPHSLSAYGKKLASSVYRYLTEL